MPGLGSSAQPFLIVLAGLPAAGKSTLARRLGSLLDRELGISAAIIASDAVRSEIPALRRAFIPELEAPVRKMTLDRIGSALKQGLCAIHDDLNYYRSMRFELVEVARSLQVPHLLIHVATPCEACLTLNVRRGRKVPDEVIHKDAERFDPPGQDPWDIPLASVNPIGLRVMDIRALAEAILAAAKAYEPWVPPPPTVHQPTRLEELDLLSRRVVGRLYQEGSRPADGRQVSRSRQKLVEDAARKGLSVEEAESLFERVLSDLFSKPVEG